MTTSTPVQSSTPALAPARKNASAWLLLLAVLIVGLGLDLWSKQVAFESVADHPIVIDRAELLANPGSNPIGPHNGVEVLPWGLLEFRLVLNSGAVFGIGAHQRWFFVSFSIVAIAVAIWIFGWRTNLHARLLHTGIALILAGAIGNLWDRLTIGRVRDFLHMLPTWRLPFGLSWPGDPGDPHIWPWIFNVADVLLLSGMGLVHLHLTLEDRRRKRSFNSQA